MTLMGSIFKQKKTNEENIHFGDNLSVDVLEQLIPIRNLSNEKLVSFSLDNKAQILKKGSILFTINELTDSAVYLLKGKVSLADENGASFDIDATEIQAKFPLTSGLKNTTTATAKSEVHFLRVSQKIMSMNSEPQVSSELIIPDNLKQNRLLQAFAQHFSEGELEVLSLPNVAIQLRNAMQNEIGVAEAVSIIQLDPVITAKLIDVANCPLYICINPAKSCHDAVNRIGLKAARSLVTCLSIKNIFSSKSPLIKKHLDQQWKDSIYLSSLSFILASEDKQINPEEALLAGLIADIGVIPFLNFVANLPSEYYSEKEIKQAIPVVKGIVGATILEKWGFSEDFINVPLSSDDWYQHSEEKISYTDIIVLSRLHSKIGDNNTHLPAMTSIPAASKLKSITLSPENSLSILHDANDKINETLKTFAS